MPFDPNSAHFLPKETGNFDPGTAVLEHEPGFTPEQRAQVADSVAEAVTPPGYPKFLSKLLLTKGGKTGDIAANVIFPLVGSLAGTAVAPGAGTTIGGSIGSTAADALTQGRQMLRGEREDFSVGSLAASAALGAVVPGPVKAAGSVAGTVAKTVATRAAQGAALGAGHEAITELIDQGKIDLGQVASAGTWSAPFGAAFGAAEKALPAVVDLIRKQTPQKALETIKEIPAAEKTPELTDLQKQIEENLGIKEPPKAEASKSMAVFDEKSAALSGDFFQSEQGKAGFEKVKATEEALADPKTVLQYSVWPRDMIPEGSRVAQIDLINENAPGPNKNVGSVSPGLLRELGTDVLEPPESLKSGAYTHQEIASALSSEASRMYAEHGFIDPILMGRIATTAGPAAYGFATGKDPEDRIQRALEFGAAGALLGKFGPGVIKNAPETIRGILEKTEPIRRELSGESAPRTSSASEESGNALVRYASAPIAATLDAANRATQVLGENAKNPEFSQKLGAVLVEDRLRAIRDGFLNAATRAADDAESAALRAKAQKVQSVIGKDGSPLKSEADFVSALRDPEIQAAIERHKEIVQPFAQEMHEKTGGSLAQPGLNTDAFVNLRAILGDGEAAQLSGVGSRQGDLTATMKRNSRFNQTASGTAEKYELDYDTLAKNMIQSNYSEAAKRDLYAQLSKDGLGVELPVGEFPEGKDFVMLPQESRGRGEAPVNFWVRKDISKEVLNAFNTRGSLSDEFAAKISKALNLVQLAGPTDATFHTANVIAAIAASPKGKPVLQELAQRAPGVNIADALTKMAQARAQIVAENPEVQQKLVELAKIGALRPESEGFISALDKAGRVALDGIYDDLVKSGMMRDSEASRREFVNQLGQYNPRLQGQVSRIAKELGVAPFIVAGRNFNRMGLRQVTGGYSGEAASGADAAKMRATNIASAAVSLIAVPAAINYLTTGKIAGRDGTPVGAIDLGVDDDQGKHIEIDPQKWTNTRRGMRITGIQAVIDGLQKDKGPDRIGGEALRDIAVGAMHPWLGPVPTAGYTLLTGKSPSGFQEAKQLNPDAKFPTASQIGENAKAAAKEAAPLYGMVAEGAQNGEGGLKGAAKSLSGAAGVKFVSDFPQERGRVEDAVEADARSRIEMSKNAQEEYAKIEKLAPADRKAPLMEIIQKDPVLFDKVINEFEYKAKGFSPVERGIARLGVEDGSRARFLANELKPMKPEQRREFLTKLVQKDDSLLSEKVLEQLAEQLTPK